MYAIAKGIHANKNGDPNSLWIMGQPYIFSGCGGRMW